MALPMSTSPNQTTGLGPVRRSERTSEAAKTANPPKAAIALRLRFCPSDSRMVTSLTPDFGCSDRLGLSRGLFHVHRLDAPGLEQEAVDNECIVMAQVIAQGVSQVGEVVFCAEPALDDLLLVDASKDDRKVVMEVTGSPDRCERLDPYIDEAQLAEHSRHMPPYEDVETTCAADRCQYRDQAIPGRMRRLARPGDPIDILNCDD